MKHVRSWLFQIVAIVLLCAIFYAQRHSLFPFTPEEIEFVLFLIAVVLILYSRAFRFGFPMGFSLLPKEWMGGRLFLVGLAFVLIAVGWFFASLFGGMSANLIVFPFGILFILGMGMIGIWGVFKISGR